ncbi:hypothetical protein TanjilG_11910 [Lupinus angustifolius]|uniref:Maternal effect embryo arrest 59 n=1 Tax=Lupinus angustifolius TaxID=3871 RepID=A0A1J7H4E3_LUPAN|nr:PREDICTED: uncharacterized protein LOC109352377 isoform X1 [Lupinus angustifolius]XP_019449891.1 PREDICTED: uncharacterized protein LOC109352377 isoform X1 [Lupinus angustifolius]XP_019454428.1 PREDICTED: uncharacterized protein LOC109355701 isoform X1 [Lupinus angustifolius]XP_019454429.1 PREDICTED: uncharacterized protein LOC109355701 isoform X1 [Lupinus angustifolius]OIW04509.1 hypothetical protein TanjilG_13891 [Lupinus angustifolius]OIW07752.1 hypothetical protein TanjilG_11910 [Lupinu
MECCKRPNRSDMHVSVEEEAIIEEETREYFDEIAPKRHTKPQRSEYSSQYVDAFSNNNDGNQSLPELLEFQRLENDPQETKLAYDGNQVTEEFVETEYYKDLNSVDKHHHTTGSGFINVEKSGKSFRIEPDNDTGSHHSSKGNPATNDWVPAPSIEEGFNSDKPNRSDN